jgi:predicted nucleic acid-binding protein
MPANNPGLPQVFIDADVLFAGSASPSEHGASLVVLRMAEITLINAVTSQQAITEAERNLANKLPAALPAFQLLVQRCVQIVPNPKPADLVAFQGMADEKDLPILVTAVREQCPWLLTFNLRHFQPGHPDVTVLNPGSFLTEVRYLLARLQ